MRRRGGAVERVRTRHGPDTTMRDAIGRPASMRWCAEVAPTPRSGRGASPRLRPDRSDHHDPDRPITRVERTGRGAPGNRTSGAPQIAPRSCVDETPGGREDSRPLLRENGTDRRAGQERRVLRRMLACLSVSGAGRLYVRAPALAHHQDGVNPRRGWYGEDRTGPRPTGARVPPPHPAPAAGGRVACRFLPAHGGSRPSSVACGRAPPAAPAPSTRTPPPSARGWSATARWRWSTSSVCSPCSAGCVLMAGSRTWGFDPGRRSAPSWASWAARSGRPSRSRWR